MDVAGSSTGAFLPTGNTIDQFEGIEVTCTDVAMPLVIARAADFGLTGSESAAELDDNRDFFAKMGSVRIAAGHAMGMGDCSQSVTKFGVDGTASRAPPSRTRPYHHPLFHAMEHPSHHGGYRQPVFSLMRLDPGNDR